MQQVTQSSSKMASSPPVIAEFQGNLQEWETRDCRGRRRVSHLRAGQEQRVDIKNQGRNNCCIWDSICFPRTRRRVRGHGFICCSDNSKSQVSFLLWKQLCLKHSQQEMWTLVWPGCFQTLPQPPLGEPDTLYLTAKLLVTVTFPVFADATNFCLLRSSSRFYVCLPFQVNRNLRWIKMWE